MVLPLPIAYLNKWSYSFPCRRKTLEGDPMRTGGGTFTFPHTLRMEPVLRWEQRFFTSLSLACNADQLDQRGIHSMVYRQRDITWNSSVPCRPSLSPCFQAYHTWPLAKRISFATFHPSSFYLAGFQGTAPCIGSGHNNIHNFPSVLFNLPSQQEKRGFRFPGRPRRDGGVTSRRILKSHNGSSTCARQPKTAKAESCNVPRRNSWLRWKRKRKKCTESSVSNTLKDCEEIS